MIKAKMLTLRVSGIIQRWGHRVNSSLRVAECLERNEQEGATSQGLDCRVKGFVFSQGRNENGGSFGGRMVFYKHRKAAVVRIYWKKIYTFLSDFRNCLRSPTGIDKIHKPAGIKSWVRVNIYISREYDYIYSILSTYKYVSI